ncbi:MAG: adenylate/guanylate cyclase domain-containing protein [Actinomycetota bacterium]|nr:adenylate/guanylate cyclase domain-containing protein [Actinomycetota bacterium]
MLFTDLVGSTDRAVGDGDTQWRNLVERHDVLVCSCVEQAGGEIIKFTGDGVLAMLPSAFGATVVAHTIKRRLDPLGLRIYAGIHLGDIDRRGGDVSGLAVNIAARIMSESAPDEVLVSDSVRCALIGSDAEFDASRTVALKGVPGEWLIHRSSEPPH